MKTEILDIAPRLTEIFAHLHENPEISWKEYKTTDFITSLLKQEGYDVYTFPNSTGLYV